jgi:transcriptional regulator with XRE-family HTH domain
MRDKEVHLLQRERLRRGLTQQELADFAQVSLRSIQRAEQGEPLRVDICKRICAFLEKETPEEIGLRCHGDTREEPGDNSTRIDPADTADEKASSQDTESEDRDMDSMRRSLVKALAGSGLTLVIAPQSLYQEMTSDPSSDDRLTFLENEMITRWALYYTGGAVSASLGLKTWMQHIIRVARSSQRTEWHERAHILLALSYQLHSCVLRDTMYYPDAHQAHRKAFLVAQELYDPELMASGLAREGVTLNQQEHALEAIQCLEHALEVIKHLGYHNLEGYILQGLSEAQARSQQSQASRMSLERAASVLARSNATPERSLTRLNIASITAQRGVNAVLLHDYQQAIKLIDESLKRYDPTLIRGRARLVAQKAEAYYGLGKVEECTTLAMEALSLGYSVGASKTIARVKNLHEALIQSPWRKEQGVVSLEMMLLEMK